MLDVDKFLVYGLTDPRTGEVRYIGKSTVGLRRPRIHALPCSLHKGPGTHKNVWIKSLLREGVTPGIAILDTCPSADSLSQREIEIISMYKAAGANLTNGTRGGEGGSFAKSAETRKRISESVKRSREDLAVRVRISRGKVNKPFVEVKSGIVYGTIVEAAVALGLHRSNVGNVLHGRAPHTRGYVFKYLEEK